MKLWPTITAPEAKRELPVQELMTALGTLRVTGGTFDSVVEMARRRKRQGHVYFIGNGGSAAIASHMAADWMKNGGFAALCFNDPALVTCLANDLGYENGFSTPIKRFGKPEDLLFAISSSGKSRNILNAVDAARSIGMEVVTLSGFDRENPLRSMGDANFYVPFSKYGIVEISHLAICHAILDRLMGET